jgi:plasmid maintenance system antidote protein VapI
MENCMVIQKMRQTLLKVERIKRNDGSNQFVARLGIAQSLGVSLGTIDNLIRERVKSISADLALKINDLHIKTIEAEIARLEKERELAVQFRLALDPDEMDEMETLLEAARARLRKLAKGRR